MATIYKIIGGGQKVLQNVQAGVPTEYVKVENSDWTGKQDRNGQDSSTNIMWCTDLEILQRWADDWAGCEVELVETEEKEEPL